MIKKPNEMKFDNKKISMIIAGVPGVGKTTLALSSPKPLLIDLENGVDRVKAQYRKDTLIAENYEELMDDLHSDLSAYETIVIDTGGKLLEMLKPVVIKSDAKNGKRDGSLSLAGYGAVKRKFADFIAFCKSLGKHLIVIFHATEVSLSNDLTGLRIRIEGSSRDEVWDDIDLGGFIEMRGKNRTLCFTNNERFYAKGTHNINGDYQIPELVGGKKNDFVSLLFKTYLEDLNSEVELAKEYENVMSEYSSKIEELKTPEELTKVYLAIKEINLLTAKDELNAMLKSKIKELGVKYDKEGDCFYK